MAKSQHTYAKKLREMEKKRKADEKRERRQNRKKNRSDSEVVAEEVDPQSTPPVGVSSPIRSGSGSTRPTAGDSTRP